MESSASWKQRLLSLLLLLFSLSLLSLLAVPLAACLACHSSGSPVKHRHIHTRTYSHTKAHTLFSIPITLQC